jgi:hypothetical protein
MTGCIRLAHIEMALNIMLHRIRFATIGLMVLLVAGCSLPIPTELPVEIPGVPRDLSELEGLLGDLGVPDLSQLANVPGLESLGGLQTPPGAIAFQGPLELGLSSGDSIPGTDIRFVGAEAGADAAQFEIAGLRAPRRLGDSLDYDGSWRGATGMSYHLRLRLYQAGNGQVRAAGVQRLIIENIAPQEANVNVDAGRNTLRFPHSVTANPGDVFPGMTLGYAGQDDRGATLRGLPEGEYPYRKMGDSIEWEGRLTPSVTVVYHLRLLYYQDANATVGGVAIVSLPGP